VHRVLESIVLLTEQRDQRSLELGLFKSLKNLFPDLDYQLLSLSDGSPPQVLLASDQELKLPPAIVAAAGDLHRETANPDGAAQSNEYVLIDMAVNDQSPSRVLVLCRRAWPGDDRRVAESMVDVYKNFTRILFDSERDTLTGLFNRKRLERRLEELTAAHLNNRREQDQTVRGEYLALLDLDRFKRINDTYGHLIGDEVLIIFSGILQDSLRDTDMCFRYGGEEFLVLVHDVTPEQAMNVLERIRANVERREFPQVGQVTVSIGCSAIDCHARPANQTVEEADRALYYAKENGRNQIRNFQALREAGLLEEKALAGSMELF
jgi:diguanylate cyclase (GGDEF)-like protein